MFKNVVYDPLYGRVDFESSIVALASAPLVQRLRHVRLSNIDSVASTGIANISRYEHAIGVAFLVSKLSFFPSLSQYEKLVLQSAALLHDWAITAFGHLVEEAYAYAGAKFDHEGKLHELIVGDNVDEVGGVDRQILAGRETGLKKWAISCVGPKDANNLIADITETIAGAGRFGQLISGSMDVDNIDNVYRVAYHMGLDFVKSSPVSLAGNISGVRKETGDLVFSMGAEKSINSWVEMRERVYDHLMLAEPDFTAKMMLVNAVVDAYRAGEISNSEWNLTDQQLISRLSDSGSKECRETVARWMTGEYWETSQLVWMDGTRPSFDKFTEFNQILTEELGRKIYSYSIKDKRKRRLSIYFEDSDVKDFGENSTQWLLGVGSPIRKSFTSAEEDRILRCAETFFSTICKGRAISPNSTNSEGSAQICLI